MNDLTKLSDDALICKIEYDCLQGVWNEDSDKARNELKRRLARLRELEYAFKKEQELVQRETGGEW